jgi:hypothetical protein
VGIEGEIVITCLHGLKLECSAVSMEAREAGQPTSGVWDDGLAVVFVPLCSDLEAR